MVDESQRQLKDCGVSSRLRHDKFSGKFSAEVIYSSYFLSSLPTSFLFVMI